MMDCKGPCFERNIILASVRGSLAYPLSDRNREEKMAERGVEVDHVSVYRGFRSSPPLTGSRFSLGDEKRRFGDSFYTIIFISSYYEPTK